MTGQVDLLGLRPATRPDERHGLVDAPAARVEPGELGAAHDLDVGDRPVPDAVELLAVVAAVDLAEPLRLAAHVLVERLGHLVTPITAARTTAGQIQGARAGYLFVVVFTLKLSKLAMAPCPNARSLVGMETLSSGASGCWNGKGSRRLKRPWPMTR